MTKFDRFFTPRTAQEREFLEYFDLMPARRIKTVLDKYKKPGPQGYGLPLILSRILKVKECILSDRSLVQALAKHRIYRVVCAIADHEIPAFNTYTTLRRRLGAQGFAQIHEVFVQFAEEYGLINPPIPGLPKNLKQGVILVADSTFLLTSASTHGEKLEGGEWLFSDPSATFGRPHPHHKFPVGHKAHSLRTVSGIPLVSLVSSASDHDVDWIFPLLQALARRYGELTFAYIILDRGYDSEDIHRGVFEEFGIIPIIIRKKTAYPEGFTPDGVPLCPGGLPMRRRLTDLQRKRTQWACQRQCIRQNQLRLFSCEHLESKSPYGYLSYTRFADGYRKFGPAQPDTGIYQKLKPLRTGIERAFGIVKQNRYRMENTNTYRGIENISIHVIEHDITLTLDIIYDYVKSGKLSPVLHIEY